MYHFFTSYGGWQKTHSLAEVKEGLGQKTPHLEQGIRSIP
tara:strand:- start:191 stop:310 length:120 start_codon:yes stop_codon:yes gene_type:complete